MAKKKANVMTRAEAKAWIKRKSNGKIFGCNFVKRRGGGLRIMVCRYGVRSHAKGVGLKFNPDAKNLLIVFDMQKIAYRCIPVEGLTAMLIAGVFYRVV